jgi:hypothetical protein
VISHNGSPSSRWKRPDLTEAMRQSGVRTHHIVVEREAI